MVVLAEFVVAVLVTLFTLELVRASRCLARQPLTADGVVVDLFLGFAVVFGVVLWFGVGVQAVA